MLVALILLACLAISLIFNLGQFASNVFRAGPTSYHGRVAGPRLDEVVREDHGAFDKIAVVEVKGIILSDAFDGGGFGMVDIIKAQLRHAEEDSRVKAVVLKVDSPGGEVLASDEIYRAIADFQKKTQKPVVASMGSVAASGGYYVSAPCRWIVANDLTITGSIGVILSAWNYRGLMDKVGVKPLTYKSGRFKDMLSGTKDPSTITPEEERMLQALIDETYAKFKRVVKEGRDWAFQSNSGRQAEKGRELKADWEEYADGRVLSGNDAFRLGFVDQLGGLKDALARARTLVGISAANVVEYRMRYDLSDLLRIFGRSNANTVKVDLGMEAPKLKPGYLYLLSPTFVQ